MITLGDIVHAMKHKRLELFVEWKKNMKKNTGMKIKVLRSDNEREYTNDPFLQLCHDEGKEKHYIEKRTLQQNSAAERINRTLLKKVRCMLLSRPAS